jgi:hypothetical protein
MKMHDCTRTKERLIDLVFDEAPDAARLRAEVESCADCRAEHRALAETLRACERATDAERPSENFWAGYHARLASRLASPDLEADPAAPPNATTTDPNRPTASLSSTSTGWLPPATDSTITFTSPTARLSSRAARLRRALSATWRVPAPAAVAAALLFVCVSVFALVRPAPLAVEPPARVDLPVEVRTVEVPVVRDKIVTRTVYVARGEGAPGGRATRAVRIEEARSTGRAHDGADGGKPRAGADTLAGFRPAADAKLRVIKGSYANEK